MDVRIGKLTSLKIKHLSAPGRYGDGGGLWLQVRDADRRSWLFRYTVAGKPHQMGLGPLGEVPLAEARVAAAECRRQLQQGIDPINKRVAAKSAARPPDRVLTFQEVAKKYVAAHE